MDSKGSNKSAMHKNALRGGLAESYLQRKPFVCLTQIESAVGQDTCVQPRTHEPELWAILRMQDWLSGVDVKFYESKINLNWKPILKSIMAVRTSLVHCTC